MKPNILLSILLALHLSSYSQTQIPNGDFEIWTDTYHADTWNSINYDNPFNIHSAQQSSEAQEGLYSAKLASQSSILGFIPGAVYLGEVDIFSLSISGGIPFTDRPTGFSFFFKYLPNGTDSMYVAGILTKWDDVNLKTDTIGFSGYYINNPYSTYTNVGIPFNYISAEMPDTLNILFSSSGFSGSVGTELFVDNVIMEYGTVISPTLCTPATDLGESGFTAHWLTIPNATSYSIDVSTTNDFSSYVSGYENFDTASDTFMIVSVPPGNYYYRVRVNYNTDVSINSNTESVNTSSAGIDFRENEITITIRINSLMVFSPQKNIRSLSIYDMQGKRIQIQTYTSHNHTFYLRNPGIYILKIETAGNSILKKVAVIF